MNGNMVPIWKAWHESNGYWTKRKLLYCSNVRDESKCFDGALKHTYMALAIMLSLSRNDLATC